MAQRTVLVDDLDETEGAETRDFALDGVSYAIDLNDKNAAKLRKALEPFIAAGRKVPGPRRVTAPRRSIPAGKVEQMSAIRTWGRANGRKVSDRGRIPKDIVDAFEKAHTPKPAKAPAKKATPRSVAAK